MPALAAALSKGDDADTLRVAHTLGWNTDHVLKTGDIGYHRTQQEIFAFGLNKPTPSRWQKADGTVI
ncbi:MAG: hypothetical protein H7232_09890 [Aeromicrobium sp.]|nr:hypothetical protein [Burkholderiales bacterium]